MMAKILIVMPLALAQAADELAAKELRSRSELIREAVRHYLANKARHDKMATTGENTDA